jgi:hypothetical protein
MNQRIIFIDLDGTLRNDKREVSPQTIDALQKTKSAGYEIVFTTGRPQEFLKALNKQCGNVCRYAIACTGSVIYDFELDKPIAVTPIDTKSVAELCKLDNPELVWLLRCDNGMFSLNANKLGTDASNFCHQITTTLHEFIATHTVCMMVVASYNYDLIKNMEPDVLAIPNVYISNRHKSLIDPGYNRQHISEIYYDIVPKGTSKGSGIIKLCEHLGIPKENRIAIGDDINDISMFEQCGYIVAMGNALPKIKEMADFVTADNNNDGVAEFLLALIDDAL